MIKRTIGTLAVLASLAVMALVALNRHDFSSMVLDGRPATEIPTQPAPYSPKPGPAETPETAAGTLPTELISGRDSVQVGSPEE